MTDNEKEILKAKRQYFARNYMVIEETSGVTTQRQLAPEQIAHDTDDMTDLSDFTAEYVESIGEDIVTEYYIYDLNYDVIDAVDDIDDLDEFIHGIRLPEEADRGPYPMWSN